MIQIKNPDSTSQPAVKGITCSNSGSSAETLPSSTNMAAAHREAESGFGSWHRRAGRPVSIWLAVLIVLLLLQPIWPHHFWLRIHIVTVGLATTSIMVWGQYFAESLLKTRLAGESRKTQVLRIQIMNLAFVVSIIGFQLGIRWLVLGGALGIGAMLAWYAIFLLQQIRVALPARFGATVWFYMLAALLMPIGSLLGALTLFVPANALPAVLLAHQIFNLLGFILLTVLGTLITLWPTILGVQLTRTEIIWSYHALRLHVGGVLGTGALICVSGLFGDNAALEPYLALLTVTGLIAITVAVSVVLILMLKQWLRAEAARFNFSTLAIACSNLILWLTLFTTAFTAGAHVVTALITKDANVSALNTLNAPLADLSTLFGSAANWLIPGFLLQILLGAMSYLMPIAMGGSRETRHATLQAMNWLAIPRVLLFQVAVAVLFLGASPTVASLSSELLAMRPAVFYAYTQLTGQVLLGVNLVLFMVALIRTIKAFRAHKPVI